MRRKLLRYAMGVLLISLTLGAGPVDPDNAMACLEHNGLDVQGNQETLASVHYVLTVLNATDASAPVRELTLPWGTPVPICPDGGVASRSDDISPLFTNLAKGTYGFWARVQDDAGNWSTYFRAPEDIEMPDVIPPSPPSGLRCST